MTEQELNALHAQALLDKRKAEIAVLKAKLSTLTEKMQVAQHTELAIFEHSLADAEAKLAELTEASDDTWHSVKHRVESAWDALTAAVTHPALK